MADLSDDLRQPGVAHHQPAAGSDAVGLVLELVRLHFVEILEAGGKSTPCLVSERGNGSTFTGGFRASHLRLTQ